LDVKRWLAIYLPTYTSQYYYYYLLLLGPTRTTTTTGVAAACENNHNKHHVIDRERVSGFHVSSDSGGIFLVIVGCIVVDRLLALLCFALLCFALLALLRFACFALLCLPDTWRLLLYCIYLSIYLSNCTWIPPYRVCRNEWTNEWLKFLLRVLIYIYIYIYIYVHRGYIELYREEYMCSAFWFSVR
jgi:hypothetical protein